MKETTKMKYKILLLFFAMILSVYFGCDVVPDLTSTGDNKDNNTCTENNIKYNEFQGYMLVDYSPKRKKRYRPHILRQNESSRELVDLNAARISDSSCSVSEITTLDGCNTVYGCEEYPLGESKAFIINNYSKKKEVLFKTGRFSTSFIDVHPDNKHFILRLHDEDNLQGIGVAEYNLENGKMEDLCDFEKEFCYSASYSPNGKHLLISKKLKDDETEKFNIYLRDLKDNSETLFITSEYNDIYPKWSKDGKFIAYGECPSMKRQCDLNECYLRLINAQNPEENLLVDDRKLCFLAYKLHFDFSPDSRHIAYTITLDPDKCGYNIAKREIMLSENKISLGEITDLTDHTGYHNLELYSSGYILRSWRNECALPENNSEINTEVTNNKNYNSNSVPHFETISSGENHVCGLDAEGFLWCWGINDWGQLGIGSSGYKTHSLKPVKVDEESRWLKISAGEGHTCGIKEDKTLWCWGRNEMGQLGNGNKGWSQNETKPIKIDDNIWIDVTAGEAHTCGIKQGNTLWCWGSNYLKQLGDNTKQDRNIPVQSTDGKWKEVYTGDAYTCGIKENNELWCWGLREQKGVFEEYYDPQAYTDLSFKYISAGEHHICGIDDNNLLWCWGEIDYHRDIDGDERFSSIHDINTYPPEQPYEGEWQQVSCGGFFTCGIKEDGTLWCWGTNYKSGQLGLGHIEEELSPVQVGTDNDWMYVSTGNSHACAIKQDNTVYCWGSNMVGQLGNGSFENRYEPVLISN